LILGLQLESSAATVSVATSAFGVVGSIVGAYFGVKIGSEQAADATGQNADLTKRVQAAETKADAYALHVENADAAQKTAQDMLRQSKVPSNEKLLRGAALNASHATRHSATVWRATPFRVTGAAR
jgi:hypothetical protein